MALPKIDVPVYELTLPYSKKKLKYRPFTVKEEKLLLFSQTEEDPKQIASSIKQVVQNCVMNNIDITDLPSFEVDFLFLKLRAVSVNNIVNIKVKDDELDEFCDVEINLDDVQLISKNNVSDKIELTNEYMIKLKFPSFKNIESVVDMVASSNQKSDFTIGLITESIESVYSRDGEEVYLFDDYSLAEKTEFLDSLTSKHLKDIQLFLSNIPVLEHEVVYETSTGEKRTRVFRGLFDFFSFA